MADQSNESKPAKKDHSDAFCVTSLIAGICSWFVPWMWYGAAAGIAAVVFGSRGIRGGNRRGLGVAGIILAVGAAVYTLFTLR